MKKKSTLVGYLVDAMTIMGHPFIVTTVVGSDVLSYYHVLSPDKVALVTCSYQPDNVPKASDIETLFGAMLYRLEKRNGFVVESAIGTQFEQVVSEVWNGIWAR